MLSFNRHAGTEGWVNSPCGISVSQQQLVAVKYGMTRGWRALENIFGVIHALDTNSRVYILAVHLERTYSMYMGNKYIHHLRPDSYKLVC